MTVPVPPAFRAAEIALVAIKQNRETTWAGLAESGKDHRLTPEQLAIVEQEMATVSQLQVVTGELVTVTYCPECGRIAFFGNVGLPAKCTLRFGCTGKPVKASPSPRREKADGTTDDSDQAD